MLNLPYDKSMNNNEEKPYFKESSLSMEKKIDHINRKLARIGGLA